MCRCNSASIARDDWPFRRIDGKEHAPEAALHVYVESVDPSQRVRLWTEVVQRISAGLATVGIRPVAFELPAGWSLRRSVAGADAPSFERVPAVGTQRIQFAGEGCRRTLPVVR